MFWLRTRRPVGYRGLLFYRLNTQAAASKVQPFVASARQSASDPHPEKSGALTRRRYKGMKYSGQQGRIDCEERDVIIRRSDLIMTASSESLGQIGLSAPETWRKKFAPRLVITGILTCIGYYLGAKLGFALTFKPHPVSVMWPPNSILLAALLLSPTRCWWFLLLCALPAHLASQMQGGVPPKMMLCWFLSNSCEALIGASLTRVMVSGSFRFANLRNVSVFLICGVFLGPLLSSFLDAGFVRLNHWGQGTYWEIWRIRFFSNVLTAVALVPALVTCFMSDYESIRKAGRGRYFEAAVVALGLVVVGFEVFVKFGIGPQSEPGLLYAPLPFLLWAAVRFGPGGASMAMFVTALIAIWGASHGQGPFSARLAEANALSLQFFLIVSAILLLLLATVIKDRERAEERYREVVESQTDLVCRYRADTTLTFVNEAYCRYFWKSREELIGSKFLELIPSTAWKRVLADIASLNKENRVQTNEHEVILPDGSIAWQQWVNHPIVEPDGTVTEYQAIGRDISDRKRAEEASRNLAHATRMSTMGALAGSLAHELNQPLTAILSNAQAGSRFLAKPTPDVAEVREVLQDIAQAAKRAGEVIRQLRTLVKKEDLRFDELELHHLVQEVVRLLHSDTVIRKVRIVLDFDKDPHSVRGDAVQLQQVILNLMLNAFDAMKDILESERAVCIRTRLANGSEVQVEVSDRGTGIHPERLARLFEPFQTTKQEGLGLGLAISRTIVEAHGGRLWGINNPDRGATFCFTMPLFSATVNSV